MAEILNLGEEQIRISQKVYGQIEYSITKGKTWKMRFKGDYQVGEFKDLIDLGPVILAIAEKGLFFSRDNGNSWERRFKPNAFTGEFIKFNFNGKQLSAETTKGIRYSPDEGRRWEKNPR